MATLEHISTGKEHTLTATFLVGRAETCALTLPSLRVSSEHAVFNWRGEGWEVRDLGSTNGTFVNRRKLSR